MDQNKNIIFVPGDLVDWVEVAENIKIVVGFKGEINFDSSKPDGSPRKLIDSSRLNSFGWSPKITLKDGLTKNYKAFLKT